MTNEAARTFGNYIAEQRKKLSMNQKELAARIVREDDGAPISPQYLNDIERDRRQPTSDHLIRQFADVLGIKPEYLFFLAGTIPHDYRRSRLDEDKVVEIFSAFRRG